MILIRWLGFANTRAIVLEGEANDTRIPGNHTLSGYFEVYYKIERSLTTTRKEVCRYKPCLLAPNDSNNIGCYFGQSHFEGENSTLKRCVRIGR